MLNFAVIQSPKENIQLLIARVWFIRNHSHLENTQKIGGLTTSCSCVHPSPHDGQCSVVDRVLCVGSTHDHSLVTILKEQMARCGDSRC